MKNQPDQPSRRTFIKWSLAATGAVSVGAVGGVLYHERESVAWHLQDLERTFISVEDRIRSHYDYLTIDEEGLATYASRHRELFGEGSDVKRDPTFYERFLLSTDFFQNGADESRLVRYVSFYDPYVSPCWNPCTDLS